MRNIRMFVERERERWRNIQRERMFVSHISTMYIRAGELEIRGNHNLSATHPRQARDAHGTRL